MVDEQFGPYRLVRMIGQGGMGQVFEAHDTEQDRVVALKRLVPQVADDPEFQRRFRRECRLASQLRSPHVIPIHRSGEIDGRLFIDMRLVEGSDLARLLTDEGALTPERAVGFLEQVASALDAAHHAGLVHRDIKPSNVLVDTAVGAHDFVYLADFGITRTIGGESQSLTGTQGIVGSLDYMAPEQFDGEVGPSIDVYALGCLLFQLLTGQRPYPVEGFPQLMKAHLNRPVPRPSEAYPALGPAFDEVVARGMAKDPAERYPSAGALAEAARAALGAGAPTVVGAALPQGPAAPVSPDGSTGVGHRRSAGSGAGTGTGFGRADGATEVIDRPATEAPPGAVSGGTTRRRVLVGVAVVVVLALLAVGVVYGTSALLTRAGVPEAGTGGAGGTGGASSDPGPVRASLATPTVQGTYPVTGRPEAITLTPDGRRALVATNSDGRDGGNLEGDAVRVLDTATGAVTASIALPARPQDVVVAPSGDRAYVSLFDPARAENTVGVLDLTAGALESEFPTGQARPFALALTPDGARLYVTNHDGADVTVVDTAARSVTGAPQVPDTPFGIVLSPNGPGAYLSQYDPGTVTAFDTRDNGVTATIPIGASTQPFALAISPDGTRLVVAAYGASTVSVIDTATNQVVATTPVGAGPRGVAIARDGRHAYVASSNADSVSVLDVATGAVTATVPVGTTPVGIGLAPDGSAAYVTDQNSDTVTVLTVGA